MKKVLVLTIVLVLSLGVASYAAQQLAGSWKSEITFAPQPLAVTGLDSTLTVDYTIGDWTFGSVSELDLSGWTTQKFSADGVLGAFTIGSEVVFDSVSAAFVSWRSTVSISMGGITFSDEFLLNNLGCGTTVGVSGIARGLTIAGTVYFNMTSAGELVSQTCCFCLSSIEVVIEFPFCCIDQVDITIDFSQTSFGGITFAVTGVEVPGVAWLTFDASLTFTTGTEGGKELTVTPIISLGDFACITLYYSLLSNTGTSPSSPATITGISFYGIALYCNWNGISFSSLSYFDGIHFVDTEEEYWEVFTIAVDGDSCCGAMFDLSIDTYFDCESTMLFDWAKTDVDVSFGVGSNLELSGGVAIDDTGLVEWTLGFEICW